MRVDTHVHLVPDDYRALLDKRGVSPLPLPPWSRRLTDELMDALRDRRRGHLARSPPGVWFGDHGLADELARLVNERIAGTVRSAPDAVRRARRPAAARRRRARSRSSRHALDVLGSTASRCSRTSTASISATRRWDPLFDELGPARRLRVPPPRRRPSPRSAAAAAPDLAVRVPVRHDAGGREPHLLGHARALPRACACSSPISAGRRRSWRTGSHRSRRASPSAPHAAPAGALAASSALVRHRAVEPRASRPVEADRGGRPARADRVRDRLAVCGAAARAATRRPGWTALGPTARALDRRRLAHGWPGARLPRLFS